MTLGDTIFAVLLAVCFIGCILFVIFGQVTVRKLRKNPETKQALGIEFTSGWDILNVAQALSLSAVLEKRLKNRAFHANTDLLHKHTTVFDRVLAQMFFLVMDVIRIWNGCIYIGIFLIRPWPKLVT